MGCIGALTLELRIEESHSLKDKRQVVKSLKEKLRARHNVAVAEVEHQDVWQRSVVAAVTVASDQTVAENTLRAVENEAASLLGGMLVGSAIEWLA